MNCYKLLFTMKKCHLHHATTTFEKEKNTKMTELTQTSGVDLITKQLNN